MKTQRIFLLFNLLHQLIVIPAFANTVTVDFMTPRDLLNDNMSANIDLHNNGGAATTVYGLYVRDYGAVIPGGNCNTQFPIYTGNSAAGSFVSPVNIAAGSSARVGSNFLYNMIFEAIYYANVLGAPIRCELPGCTWGTDSTIYDWCIRIGALAPVLTTAGYTSNVPPSGISASSPGLYNYNLISNYVLLGPISCSDKSLTCEVATLQTQSFS